MKYTIMGYVISPLIKSNKDISLSFGECESNDSKREYLLEEYNAKIKNHTLLLYKDEVKIRIIYYDVATGVFIIDTPKVEVAYEIAYAIYGILTIFFLQPPAIDGNEYFWLVGLSRSPRNDDNVNDIIEYIKKIDKEYDPKYSTDFKQYTKLSWATVEKMVDILKRITLNNYIVKSFESFIQSNLIHYGMISYSYYEHHHKYWVENMSAYRATKDYYENRVRYEAAFVECFKAIEWILGASRITKQNIVEKLNKLDIFEMSKEVKYSIKYMSFETGGEISYVELLQLFLDMRNSVAAHANVNPPRMLRVDALAVWEIQMLYRNILESIVVKMIN